MIVSKRVREMRKLFSFAIRVNYYGGYKLRLMVD